MEPRPFTRPRRKAISGEAEGAYNPRRAGRKPETFEKTPEEARTLETALRGCPFFQEMEPRTMELLVSAMPIKNLLEGERIIQQGAPGDSAYVLLSGECYICDEAGTAEIYNKDTKNRPSKAKFKRALTSSTLSDIPDIPDAAPNRLGSMTAPRFFGEIAMLWGALRTVSVYAAETCVLAELPRDTYTNLVVLTQIEIRNHRTEVLRKVKLLETLQDDKITQLADALEKEVYEEGDVIIQQGATGKEFFVVESGECKATVRTGASDGHDGADVQEHRRYGPGELFGEKALLQGTVRAASITATCRSELLKLTRRKFERLLGSLNELGDAHYLTDPRKDIAEFYRQGDAFGPSGSKRYCDKSLMSERDARMTALGAPTGKTDWFCVYRPTSRDAISKLLSGNAVGKGLNVKGKSAKRGRLSGFVPFLQIHDNNHKKDIEESPEDSWIEVFYESEAGRDKALEILRAEAEKQKQAQANGEASKPKTVRGHRPGSAAKNLNKDPYEVTLLSDYSEVYGLDVPERVLREIYILQPDLTFLAGWETGRNSEPAFMDMNLHSLRDGKEPKVVLYQFDQGNPMNPQGLLIAYAEAKVKPVVSDFDTFLVGSRGVIYEELSAEQASVASWALDRTVGILENPSHLGWNSRWLDVLQHADEDIAAIDHAKPKYGYGDPTSYRLTAEVVAATIESGAVRHGAECFNFFFPQELDDEYLVVWENFPDKPWTYKKEEPLRNFLLERIAEGFSFPLNPVWPVRDPGWYRIFEALQGKIEAAINLVKWMPRGSALMDKVQEIHKKYPQGFKKNEVHQPPPLAKNHTAKEAFQHARKRLQTMNMIANLMDVQACEHADYLLYKKKKPKISLKGEEEVERLKAAGQLAAAANKTKPKL